MNTAKINDPCKQCDSVIFERCLDVYKVAGVPPCSKRAVENCHSLQQLKAEIAALIPRVSAINTLSSWVELSSIINKLRELSAFSGRCKKFMPL